LFPPPPLRKRPGTYKKSRHVHCNAKNQVFAVRNMPLHLAGRGQVNAGAGLPFAGTTGIVGRLPGVVPGKVPLRPPLVTTVAMPLGFLLSIGIQQ
jgi:hypothetical protein